MDAMNYSEGIFYGISMECQTDMNGVYFMDDMTNDG
jgi:hypothetical protein